MKVISQREFDRNPAQVLEALEAGEAYRVMGEDAEVVELRPPGHGQTLTTDEVIELVKDLPEIDYAQMRAEADEFFGNEDRIGDDDPSERRRG
ncbi:PhdYeFM domain-containing protein [Saccharothrix sp. 6-C]|uniref:PhdYeFM domain-containing protein n=1 Tax=Saccharothrix sp. 6-C TaxID=2781735 RepID=UPI00191750EF|nr:PhdYeFM domain-containing protein [Saccharothrix sp. 6-C]QQQ76802.1 PhdYeFM domain-containing protein [Saccharothrix sp. 6-C]